MKRTVIGEKRVQGLIRGSEAIDRMRNEIQVVVNGTLGLLNKAVRWQSPINELFGQAFGFSHCRYNGHTSERNTHYSSVSKKIVCVWEVVNLIEADKFMPDQDACDFGVRCWAMTGANDGYIAYDSREGPGAIRYTEVQFIRENLHVFTDGIARDLPALNRAWKPILNAAEAE